MKLGFLPGKKNNKQRRIFNKLLNTGSQQTQEAFCNPTTYGPHSSTSKKIIYLVTALPTIITALISVKNSPNKTQSHLHSSNIFQSTEKKHLRSFLRQDNIFQELPPTKDHSEEEVHKQEQIETFSERSKGIECQSQRYSVQGEGKYV